jgi:hypothetical protein
MRFLSLVVLALSLSGCQRFKYDLDLKPDGAAMQRSLTIAAAANDNKTIAIQADELERLAQVYATTVKDKSATKATLLGTFDRTMPQDIGGAGTHATFETSLGTFHIYTERFRGQDDLLLQWERQAAAVDLFVDLAITWAEQNLKGEQGLDRLHAFLDQSFRRDLKNALLYIHWSGIDEHRADQANDEHARNQLTEAAAMIGQYLLSRGYFEVDDIPHLYNIATDDRAQDYAIALARRQILTRMGRAPKGELPPKLSSLSSIDSWRDSLDNFVRTDPGAQARINAWAEMRKPEDSEAVDKLLGAALGDLLDMRLLSDSDELTLHLHTPERPFATNGTWDSPMQTVTWQRSLEVQAAGATGLPPTAVALWCEPNASAQTRLFGKVILNDSELASYCLDRLALSEADAAKWDLFLGALTPESTAAAVRKFRFSGHEADESAEAIAETVAAGLESRTRPEK